MRTQSVYLALVIVLLFPTASAQLVQTNGRNDIQVSHHPVATSIGLHTAPLLFRTDKFIRDGLEGNTPPADRMTSPQSPIYVIDTAIARNVGDGVWYSGDTTRQLFSFNAKAKVTSDLEQKLNEDLWVNARRWTYTYNANENMVATLHENWGNGQWVNYERSTCTYDAKGNMVAWLSEQWPSVQWVNGWRGTCTYDSNGNLLSESKEEWSNGQWLHSPRLSYTYDVTGNKLSMLEEVWSNGQWVNYWRSSSTYDDNGNMLSFSDDDWMNDQWVNFYTGRLTYSYDAQKHMLSKLIEHWLNGQWVSEAREAYTYDANGKQTTYLYESCSNGQWVNLYRRSCTYDEYQKLISVWNYAWNGLSWVPWHASDRSTLFGGWVMTDSAGNQYNLGGSSNITLSWKTVVTGIALPGRVNAATYSLSQNYPNPFNPSTTIKYELSKPLLVRLSVFDMLGREVSVLVNDRKDAGVHEVRFDGSNLSSGVYFCRLQAGDFVQTKRLVLLK